MAHKYTKDEVLDAIEGSAGILLTVAKRLQCTWDTAQRWVNKWEETKTALKNETEKVLDMAEGQVYKAIQANDLQTAKWVLSRKGKERGWGEDNSLKLVNDDPLNINLTGDTMTAEELQNATDVEITGTGDGE